MKPYAYIFIRQDIPNAQRVVQSSHLAWELSKQNNLQEHPSMVVIGIKTLPQLLAEMHKVELQGFSVVKFQEPLFNNEVTAFGVLTTEESERRKLRKYQLLTDYSFYPEKLQNEIKLKNCTHSKSKPEYYETLRYEYTPGRKCTKCGKRVAGELSDHEKKQLYINWHKDLFDGEFSPSIEEIETKKNGFNI